MVSQKLILILALITSTSIGFAKDKSKDTQQNNTHKKRAIAQADRDKMALNPQLIISIINEQIGLNLQKIESSRASRIKGLKCPSKLTVNDFNEVTQENDNIKFEGVTVCYGSEKKVLFVGFSGLMFKDVSDNKKTEYVLHEFNIELQEDVDSI